MTGADDSQNPLQRGKQAAPSDGTHFAKQPYRAAGLSREPRRHLEIRLKFPDPAESPSYSALTSIRHEWRFGKGFTLVYGKAMMVMVRGDNLQEIYQALKEWRVEWLAAFDSHDHEAPTDEDAPFIQSITILTTRPEDPPSIARLH